MNNIKTVCKTISLNRFTLFFNMTSYALSLYLLLVALIPSGRKRFRSTSRVRIVTVSRRHESEYHLQKSMGTVVASSSHIVPTIRWKALPQILEAAPAESTIRNERGREIGKADRKKETAFDRAQEEKRARGTGSFNIPTERPTDLPTYQPTA